MAQPTPAQLLRFARQHYEAGCFPAAEPLCRKILADDPGCTPALCLLSLMAERTGHPEAAAAFLRQAAAAAPTDPVLQAEQGHLYHRRQRLDEAVVFYRRWAELQPNDGAAWGYLADALYEKQDYIQAAQAYRRAWECRPEARELVIRQGDALQCANLPAEAVAVYRQALAAGVEEPKVYCQLGRALHQTGHLEEASAAYRQALALNPRLAPAHDQLGVVQHQQSRFPQALESYQRALAIDPSAQTYLHQGQTLRVLGRIDAAVAAYAQALLLRPDDTVLASQMDNALRDLALLDIAILQQRQRIADHPKDPQAHFDLGMALQRRGLCDAAIDSYRHVLALHPDHLATLNNLALLLSNKGQLDEALDYFSLTVSLHPETSICHSNLLYSLHFHPGYDAAAIKREHGSWQRRHAEPLKRLIQPHVNDRSPGRRLRIGYVSPNFTAHPVGRFLSAFFPYHDHRNFEVVCYASLTQSDAVTERIRQGADRWINVAHLDDAALAEQIRRDHIDILIDLTMHMANNRLLVFARKPAPVQLTYLAYCSTTGLDTIDYRLTDPYLDPPPLPKANASEADSPKGNDRCYFERSIHLPRTYWCYHPGLETPEVNPLPALARGYVTFASLNNFSKVSPAVLELWAQILQALPESRLVVHTVAGSHRTQVRNLFAARGVAPERLWFFDHLALPDYFKQHHQIDIALDPFPYPGGTTTCDALWMGVPTVSLVGQAAFTRSGLSIFSNLGLPEWATLSPREYLATALDQARNLPRLAQLRATLRDRLRGSPLMEAPRFARDLETIYRTLWQRWCAR